ncbi:MAG: anthranilate phosphoribosyltransferase [Pseudomonadota bacterium]|nr:anthranilate phosphoribosyltransferase [Pseudomonadota bacterium]
MHFKEILALVAEGHELDSAQAEAAFDMIMSGDATPAQIGAFLMSLRMRGETVTEIAAAATVMRRKAIKVSAPPNAIDVVGTGGDGSGTLNISTGAALTVAGCGIPVAKHGNRALSSKSGAADVLNALGVNIDADMRLIEKSINEAKIGFMMAPRHHSATRHVAGPRVELAIRTVFNMLGPLSNPAMVDRLVVGVFAPEWVKPVALVLAELGAKRAWVVHGTGGLDELATNGPAMVASLDNGKVESFEVEPEDAGLKRCDISQLQGGDAAYNAEALQALLNGQPSAYRDTILFTSAAALIVAGVAENLKEGVSIAEASIDNGKAQTALKRMAEISQEVILGEEEMELDD